MPLFHRPSNVKTEPNVGSFPRYFASAKS